MAERLPGTRKALRSSLSMAKPSSRVGAVGWTELDELPQPPVLSAPREACLCRSNSEVPQSPKWEGLWLSLGLR